MVFRGKVLQVNQSKNSQYFKEGIASITVDRWYKGVHAKLDLEHVPVHFAYGRNNAHNGHDCSDLVLDSYWIFFAKHGDEGAALELFHDCQGALRISSQMGPQVTLDVTAQIEVDFRAGLTDSDPAARLVTIQRLAGLASPASRDALKDVIAHGGEQESGWALFAAVKTGDASVMPLAVPVLIHLKHDKPGPYPNPQGLLALALRELHTLDAVPYLVLIVDQAPDELVRDCAMQSLAELKSAAALPTYARHLTDSSIYVRYNALLGMKYVTQAPACSNLDPQKTDAAELACRQWWDSAGQQEFRSH